MYRASTVEFGLVGIRITDRVSDRVARITGVRDA